MMFSARSVGDIFVRIAVLMVSAFATIVKMVNKIKFLYRNEVKE